MIIRPFIRLHEAVKRWNFLGKPGRTTNTRKFWISQLKHASRNLRNKNNKKKHINFHSDLFLKELFKMNLLKNWIIKIYIYNEICIQIGLQKLQNWSLQSMFLKNTIWLLQNLHTTKNTKKKTVQFRQKIFSVQKKKEFWNVYYSN